MLTNKDVAIVIPTYNRSEDVNRTLSFVVNQFPGKVVVVDQSKDDKIKLIVNKYKKKLNIEFIHSEVPSLSIAQNLGINKIKDKYKIILIIDDDIDLLENYVKNLVDIYNNDSKVMAVGGSIVGINYSVKNYNFSNLKNKLSNLIFKIFFLPYKENHQSRITGPYGIVSPPNINKSIEDAEWIPGSNESFRSVVFDDYEFPKTLGYTVVEDLDSSYSVFRKYGKGSLVRTPKCLVNHHHSEQARYGNKKRIFTNHEDHFYFYYRHFNNFPGAIKMVWSLTGIILGNFIKFVFRPNKERYLHFKYNLQAITYCYKNKENIKNQRFRLFDRFPSKSK